METNKKYYIIAVIASALLITFIHYSIIGEVPALHDIYRELYYIPLLIGALAFGLRGAIFSYLFVAVLYLPYLSESWTGTFLFETKRFIFLLVSGVFSFLAGFLVDMRRKQLTQLEKNRYLAGLGQVATTIVHDLKNPLITILGFARRIQEGKGDTATAIQTVIDSAENMQKIVYDVLDFSKNIKMEVKGEDVGNIIRQSIDSCMPKADAKEVELSVNIPNEPLTANIAGFHIQRALINLMNNAIDSTEKGQKIFVSGAFEKDSLVIKLVDQGSGMDKNTLENIFIPFYTNKSSGTGLGMSIAKKIIEGHNGRIKIKSQLGKGTEVIITLPVGRDQKH